MGRFTWHRAGTARTPHHHRSKHRRHFWLLHRRSHRAPVLKEPEEKRLRIGPLMVTRRAILLLLPSVFLVITLIVAFGPQVWRFAFTRALAYGVSESRVKIAHVALSLGANPNVGNQRRWTRAGGPRVWRQRSNVARASSTIKPPGFDG